MSWALTVHYQVGKVCSRGPARHQGRGGGGEEEGRAHRGERGRISGGDWGQGEG